MDSCFPLDGAVRNRPHNSEHPVLFLHLASMEPLARCDTSFRFTRDVLLTCLTHPAYRGAKFLTELVEHRALVPTPHVGLEEFYSSVASRQSQASPPPPPPTATGPKSSGDAVVPSKSIPPEPFLLSRPLIPDLLSAIQKEPSLPSSPAAPADAPQQDMKKLSGLEPELARAVDQVSLRLSSSTTSH